MYYFLFFFFNDTATTEIYPLSLHDALPISAILLSSGDSREITIGPVRIVLLVANQPIKDLEPKLGFILTLVGRDRELGEEPAQPPALCTVGQQEPRPRHERVRAGQRLRGPVARPTHCRRQMRMRRKPQAERLLATA